MNKRIFHNIFFPVIMLGAGMAFIIVLSSDKAHEILYRNLFLMNYRVFVPAIPDQVDFAGEKAPLDIYYVRESLDREIMAGTFMHSSTIQMFKRANRWFPVIEPILKANRIPDDFKYLALAESNLGNVVSPSGAEGFWQFLKGTAQKYNLEVTEEVDERYNVEKATQAACDYFKDAFIEYGNWTLVAASFNRGMDGVSKAVEKQKVKNYYDLYLVDETSRYIYRILAIKEVYTHPVRYGFYLKSSDFYPVLPFTTVSVDTAITDLADFAFKMKVNYRILREYNPWLKRYNLPNKTGKTYVIKLPKDGSVKYDLLRKSLPESDVFFNDTLKINQLN